MRPLFALFLATLTCFAAPPETPEPQGDAKTEAKKPAEPVTRKGSVTIAGKAIDYEVTTAELVLENDKDEPRASIFHVSYFRKGITDTSKRPVLFAFNGGPGSSAVWLHLGMLGPKRVDFPGDGTNPPAPPARLVNNAFSVLDVADLVFVDPVSTGYSRVGEKGKPEEFHGVEGDIDSLADFIRRWVTEHQRWDSPKYLLGESYGGIRVAGLADELQSSYGMSLNGVVLLSSLIDFRTLTPGPGNDLAYLCYLPTYTATAHYHGKLEGDRDALVEAARAFAAGDYATALLAGRNLSPERLEAVAGKLSALTSVPAQVFIDHHLRLSPFEFRGALLADEDKIIGRFDARVAWQDNDPAQPNAWYDPSFSVALGPYSTAMLSYLGDDLGWKENSPYEILTGKVQPWKMGDGNGYVNMTDRLVSALRDNPHLRVLVMIGATDLATPGDAIRHSFEHMLDLPDNAADRIAFTNYEAGHMFYLNPPDLEKSRADLIPFLTAP